MGSAPNQLQITNIQGSELFSGYHQPIRSLLLQLILTCSNVLLTVFSLKEKGIVASSTFTRLVYRFITNSRYHKCHDRLYSVVCSTKLPVVSLLVPSRVFSQRYAYTTDRLALLVRHLALYHLGKSCKRQED